MEARKEVFESVKDGVVGTIRGTGDVAKAVVDTVSETVSYDQGNGRGGHVVDRSCFRCRTCGDPRSSRRRR